MVELGRAVHLLWGRPQDVLGTCSKQFVTMCLENADARVSCVRGVHLSDRNPSPTHRVRSGVHRTASGTPRLSCRVGWQAAASAALCQVPVRAGFMRERRRVREEMCRRHFSFYSPLFANTDPTLFQGRCASLWAVATLRLGSHVRTEITGGQRPRCRCVMSTKNEWAR